MTNDELKTKGKDLLNLLAESGHKEKVRIDFSGSGDSGGIDHITGLETRHALYRQVRDWAEDFAGELPNWWDNDGGQGFIEMNPETKQIEYSVEQSYTASEVADQGTF